MFTDRNVFNLIYKKKLLSYYVYEQVSSSKKTLRICDVFFIKNSMVSYEQVISSNKTLSICAKKMFMKNSKLTWFSTKKSVYETEH